MVELFCLESPRCGDGFFDAADTSDDQKLIGPTAEEFVVRKCFHMSKILENRRPAEASLVEKGRGIGFDGRGCREAFGGAWRDKIATSAYARRCRFMRVCSDARAHAGIGRYRSFISGRE